MDLKMKWIKKSNRMKHFAAGFFLAYVLTLIGAIAGGIYKELKDPKFDWLDLLATVLGGLIGTVFPILAVFVYLSQGFGMVILFYFMTPFLWSLTVIGLGSWGEFKQMVGEIKDLFR